MLWSFGKHWLVAISFLSVLLGMGVFGMTDITIAQSLDRRANQTKQPDHRDCEVLQVDYLGKTIKVRLGASAKWVQIAAPLRDNLGTVASPLVRPGDRVRVVAWGSESPAATEWVAAYFLPRIGVGMRDSVPTPALPAPVWNSGYPRIAGVNLEGAWSIVPGATQYEVWYNTSAPSPNGATLYDRFTANQFSRAWNLGQTSELLQNGGLESGDFTNWVMTAYEQLYPGTSSPRTGLFSLVKKSAVGGFHSFSTSLESLPLSVVAAQTYTLSAYFKVIAGATTATVHLRVHWYNSSGSLISDNLLVTNSAKPSTYTLISSAATSPAGAVTATFWLDVVGTEPTGDAEAFWVDDCSFIGQVLIMPTSYLFAVRALDANGNASPFSTWLNPIQVSAKIGENSLEIDYANERIQSSDFAAGAGFRLTQYGLAGTGWAIGEDAVPVYVSASSIKFTGVDVTARYIAGTKLRFKQGGAYKYFYVLTSSYAASDTTITVTGGSDYSVANAAITDFYYSYAATPQGHPIWFNWVTTASGFTAAVVFTQSIFRCIGNMCEIFARDLSGTSNSTSFTWTLPLVSAAVVVAAALPLGVDNGGNVAARADAAASATVTMYSNPVTAAGWTNSGAKGLYHVQFVYPI